MRDDDDLVRATADLLAANRVERAFERAGAGRCSAHVLDGGRLYGCPDPAAGETTATGTGARSGAQVVVGLCVDHLALVESGQAITFTLALGRSIDARRNDPASEDPDEGTDHEQG